MEEHIVLQTGPSLKYPVEHAKHSELVGPKHREHPSAQITQMSREFANFPGGQEVTH